MIKALSLNLICAGFPRCGTTALAKYFEEYTNVKVLRDPDTGAYEYNGLSGSKISEYYESEMLSSGHIFHKFSGYTYIDSIASSFNLTTQSRKNTIILFMLGNQYERLRSWHAFHKSKAVSGTDKTHFTYKNRDFYANCSLSDYYQEFAIGRIDYLSSLVKIVQAFNRGKTLIIKQEDLRQHPEEVLGFLSNELEFELYPVTKHLNINSTILEPGITLAEDFKLADELNQLYLQTLSWAKANSLLIAIDHSRFEYSEKSKFKSHAKPTLKPFKPVKFESISSDNLNTVLVIGNGPSASLVNFESLKNLSIPTCGMNSAYRLWEKIDFRPTYYICMDSVVIKSHAPAISRLIDEERIQLFFLRNEFLSLYPQYANHPRILWFDQILSENNPLFTTNWITTGSWSLRWMASIGYKLIASIGIDANYQEVLKEATKTGDLELEIHSTPKYNPNYFFDDYQLAGDEYNIPNDPLYVAKHGTTVHADAVIKVREDIDNLNLPIKIFDLSPLSEHNAFSKLPLTNYLSIQQVSLTTSFCFRFGREDEAMLNAEALCFNLSQSRIASINLLFEGDFTGFCKVIDSKCKITIDHYLSNGKLVLIPITKRPSYLELFTAAKKGTRSLAIVCNSDLIYPDNLLETICVSFSLQSPLSVYCLTRWNKTENGTFLQGQVPSPPWQEIPLDQMELLSDINYLSYDTYVFNKELSIPDSFSEVFIGTFGCDTAIAAIFRVYGVLVSNPCLDLKTIHIDNKPRNYSGEVGTEQVLRNVDAFKSSLNHVVENTFADSTILSKLEKLESTSLSIGTPTHALGWWYCVFRMFGATPWGISCEKPTIRFEKFYINPATILDCEQELSERFENAMRRGYFLEIIVDGSNRNHYLGCFNQSEMLKEIKSQLFRYDRQYVLFEKDVDEKSRRAFDKFMLILKNQFSSMSRDHSLNILSSTFGKQSLSFPLKKAQYHPLTVAIDHINRNSLLPGLQERILIIDPTPLGSNSATGQIKRTLFGHLPLQNILQVWEHTGSDPGLRIYKPSENLDPNAIPPSISKDAVIAVLSSYSPTIVYFRSTASELLHLFHQAVISTFDIPSIIHIMDDWEGRMLWDHGGNMSPKHVALSRLLRTSIQISQLRLSICKQMSVEFSKRYSCSWIELSNAVEPISFPQRESGSRYTYSGEGDRTCTIKYMGGLADDMNSQSILEIATQIDRLSTEGLKVHFDIYTMDWYMDWAKKHLDCFKSCTINRLVPSDEYAATLISADVLVIAYNFDDKSVAYTRLSMANKLPEILAAGRLLFAYGPLEIATIEEVSRNDLGVVVGVRDTAQLRDRLRQVILDEELRRAKAKSAYDFTRSHFSLPRTRRKLNALLGLAAAKKHRLC